ncbi:hypothetical protein PJ985_06975 [Streptomyces sp. ACA25]|uniref:Acg family FMN-binding oxidoreductase n=1 Tax=Streptomyces sp. ACA25 TaxID=3022596 RepID=UPI002307F9F9|nr:hypothetical protein [Streptomyces sp. ACA25]MDB1087309.1 hypothetical protein [Streptomyces sp. ACA25]
MRRTLIDAAVLEKLLSAALAAPSIHNTQPWRCRLDPETATLEIHAATDRGLRHTDPMARALHISVGAAVFNLRVAVAHFGWEPVVRLLPRPDDPQVLASVRLGGTSGGGVRKYQDLYDVLWQRHSSRFPFSPQPLPPQVRAELTEAAHAEGARLTLPGHAERTRLLQLTAAAEQRNSHDPGKRAEHQAWVRDNGTDGIPRAALGPRDASGRLPTRDFTGLRAAGRDQLAVFESDPVIAVLATGHDTRADWLRAGQALEHVLLAATAHSVRASLLFQATEWTDLRPALAGSGETSRHVHTLIRLGYGPVGPATPRRSAGDVLTDGTAHTEFAAKQEVRELRAARNRG